MASEKDNFKKAIGYIKYELSKSNEKECRILEKELDFWVGKWSYSEDVLALIKPATELSIESDLKKDASCPEYLRTAKVSKLLNNDFDRMILKYLKQEDENIKLSKKSTKINKSEEHSEKDGVFGKLFKFIKR